LNCFTPVACAVETRLNGGNRLVSTYGAKPAAPSDGVPDELLAEGAGDALGAGDVALADGLGAGVVGTVVVGTVVVGTAVVGTAVGVAAVGVAAVGEAPGAGPPLPLTHEAPLIVQPLGWPAVPAADASKPTVAVPPGAMVASQLSFVTVTWPPSSVNEPSHREVSDVPCGSVKPSVQPVIAEAPELVIVYWPE
jgi:hypothetical protein